MTTYNLTNLTNSSGMMEVGQAVSDASGGMLGTMILLMVSCIVFLSLKNYSTKAAVLVSMFMTTSTAIFLRMLGWVGDKTLIIMFILLAGAFVFALVYKYD